MISNRIKEIASMIFPYRSIADVGCDHGYLIIEAFKKQYIDFAMAIDNKEGPLSSAKSNIKKYDFFQNVEFSLSSGIDEVRSDIDVIVISGMGGILITNILSNTEKLINCKRLILQANRNVYEVRKFIMENGFYIVDEAIIKEDGKFYEIIKADRGIVKYSEEQLMFGPILLKNKNEIFLEKLSLEIEKLKKVNVKNEELIEKINRLETLYES